LIVRIKCNPFMVTSEISISLNQMLFSYKRINKIITSIRSLIILCKDFSFLDIISLSFRNHWWGSKRKNIWHFKRIQIDYNKQVFNLQCKINKKLIKQALKSLFSYAKNGEYNLLVASFINCAKTPE